MPNTPAILALSAAALAAACAHSAPRTPAAIAAAAQSDSVAAAPVALRIVSHNSSDVIIYAGQGRMRQRLGTVTGATTRMLAIPARFTTASAGFYLVAHRVGGRAGAELVSPTVTVQPGQTVVWTIESELPSSSIAIE